jgi:hypothetical protein
MQKEKRAGLQFTSTNFLKLIIDHSENSLDNNFLPVGRGGIRSLHLEEEGED